MDIHVPPASTETPSWRCARRWVGTLALLATVATAHAHLHLQIGYGSAGWDLHVLDFETGRSEPGEYLLVVPSAARQHRPSGSGYDALLGTGDGRIWVLPQTEQAGVPFLGIGTSGIRAGEVRGNRLQLRLQRMSGPGEFAAFTLSPFGQPIGHITTADGIDPSRDLLEVPAVNGHVHLNWAFTAPGTYRLGFTASAIRASDGAVLESATTDYTFRVLPPPPPRLSALRRLAEGGLLLEVEVGPGESGQLLESTDLREWRVTTQFSPSSTGRHELEVHGPRSQPGTAIFWKVLRP